MTSHSSEEECETTTPPCGASLYPERVQKGGTRHLPNGGKETVARLGQSRGLHIRRGTVVNAANHGAFRFLSASTVAKKTTGMAGAVT
ncbi:hypothetical protein CSUI_005289 [Cystoisospora suis]|uniref:Uncharacterized protein n=1 Tax=Cystoisospora suis TaxID=483139 RepID=A0A2C6K736_9APIC|nr:hypothetical protein CSUI_005289 [Cystoisospora suis]